MMRLSIRGPIPSVIGLALLLAAAPARAIHCVEYALPSGRPAFHPYVVEMDAAGTAAARESFTQVLSRKPKVKTLPRGRFAHMPGESAADLAIIGIQSARTYARPSGFQVEGFVKEAKNAKEEPPAIKDLNDILDLAAASTGLRTDVRSASLRTQQRWFAYGKPRGALRTIKMETNEVIAVHAPIDPDHQLLVTVRVDQKIGFYANADAQKRNFLIEVYQLDPGGYSYVGFRVAAGEVPFPRIRILADAAGKMALQVEERFFNLELLDLKALAEAVAAAAR